MNENFSSIIPEDPSHLEKLLERYLFEQRANMGFESKLPYGPTNNYFQAVGNAFQQIINAANGPTNNNTPVNTNPIPKTKKDFIDKILPGAKKTFELYNIPVAVILAQACEESGWGKSDLASKYNNLFGIKGSGPAGTIALRTREGSGSNQFVTTANFRVYHNWEESIMDHGRFLTGPRYKKQGIGKLQNADDVARALQAAGYAGTNTEYASKLINLMRTNNLYQY
jgi:flagellum-specific peptidoglycan hydrolase FlgJ